MTLNNGGEVVQLLDGSGVAIDTANQAGAWFAGKNTSVGEAMERNSVVGDGEISGNWHTSTGDSGGRVGTPKNMNSADPAGPADVVINEIMYNPSGIEPDEEWVELYNFGSEIANVSGWKFTDGEGTYEIPQGISIAEDDYLVLGRTLTAANGGADLIYGGASQGSISLSNSGDQPEIQDAFSVLVDKVPYLFSWGGNGSDKTLARKSSSLSSDSESTWATSSASGGSPGSANSVNTVKPTITHSAIPVSYLGRDVTRYATVTDDEGLLDRVELFWRKVGNTTYQIITFISSGNDDYTAIIDASLLDTTSIEYYIEAEDANNNIATSALITTDFNQISDSVVINEIMYDPPGADPGDEWFELHNISGHTISLDSWTVSDLEGMYTFPDSSIPAGGFFVVGNSSSAAGGNVDLTYSGIQTGSIVLKNSGSFATDQLVLKDASGIVVDDMNYDPGSGGKNGTGPTDLSLERQDTNTATSNDASNWRSSTTSGGTPGSSNSANFLANVSISPEIFNPNLSETALICYELQESATVTVQIVDINDPSIVKRTLVNGVQKSPGVYFETWDGKDDGNNVILGAFNYVVTAFNGTDTITDNTNETDFNILNENITYSTISTGMNIPNGTYTAQENRTTNVSFLFTKPATVTIKIFEFPSNRELVTLSKIDEPFAGSNQLQWLGFDSVGRLNPSVDFTINFTNSVPYPGNAVITKDQVNLIPTLVDRFAFSEGESSTIHFDLNRQADVKIEIYSLNNPDSSAFEDIVIPDTEISDTSPNASPNTLVKVLLNQTLSQGSHQVSWDGTDASGETFVTPDSTNFATYIFVISAVNGTQSVDTEYVHVQFFKPVIWGGVLTEDTSYFQLQGSSSYDQDTVVVDFDSFHQVFNSINLNWISDSILVNDALSSGIHSFSFSAKNGLHSESFDYKISAINVTNISDTELDPDLGETVVIKFITDLDDTVEIRYVYTSEEVSPADSFAILDLDAFDTILKSETITVIATEAGVEHAFIWDGNDSTGQPIPFTGDVLIVIETSVTKNVLEALESEQTTQMLNLLGFNGSLPLGKFFGASRSISLK